MSLCILVAAKLRIMYAQRQITSGSSKGIGAFLKVKAKIEDQHMFAFLFLLFMLYASVSATVMKTFKCSEVDGQWWLDDDYRIGCFTSKWNLYMPIALLGVIAYTIGIPVFVFWHCD